MVDVIKSLRISGQFPQFFDFEGSSLVAFMKYYYEWMETLGPDFFSRRILSYNDIDFRQDSHEMFDEFLKNEFMQFVPSKLTVDNRFLIKHIKDFYKAKGTEDAVKILFRILYNEEVEFEYPGRFMLRASDGRWLIEQSMKIVLLVDSIDEISIYDFFVGSVSGATAKIQKIEQKLIDGVLVTEAFINNRYGNYIKGEVLRSRNTGIDLAVFVNEPDSEIIYPGRYTTTDGFLSWDRVLQDNHYYQDYSYVIKSSRDSSEYADVLRKLTHPAGSIFFTEFNLRINIEAQINSVERFLTKRIDYEIPMNEFIQLSLESDVQQGSYAGKYILVYELSFEQAPLNYSEAEEHSGSVSLGRFFNSTTDITENLEPGNIVRIHEPTEYRTYFMKIKNVTDSKNFEVHGIYPYKVTTGLQLSVLRKDYNDSVSPVNNKDVGTVTTNVMNFEKYADLNNLDYAEINDTLYVDLMKNKYMKVTDIPDMPIVHGSIMSIYDNINNPLGDFYVKSIKDDQYVEFFDEYEEVETTNLNYVVTNV